jgi:DNA-3-methyladenine glycosylase
LTEPWVGDRTALPRSFYRRDPRVVAPELLNKLLVAGARAGRIVEVEAYCGSEDPGSHAYRGLTPRNAVMFGPPGRLYVYRSYGVHWCANAVCAPDGVGEAVLIRALAPVSGADEIREARSRGQIHPLAERDLCRGPGRLCQALGISIEHNGADLVAGDRGVRILDDGMAPPDEPGVSVRIGLTKGAEHPWRFFVPGDRHVSGRISALSRGAAPEGRGADPAP